MRFEIILIASTIACSLGCRSAPEAVHTEAVPATDTFAGRAFVDRPQTSPEDDSVGTALSGMLAQGLASRFSNGVLTWQELSSRVDFSALAATLGADDTSGAVDLARHVEAQYLILSSISRFDDRSVVNIALFDVAQNRVINRVSKIKKGDVGEALAEVCDEALQAFSAPREITKDEANLILHSRAGLFQYCYNKALMRDPTLAGDVVVKFYIDQKGTVTAVDILPEETTLHDDLLNSCIEAGYLSLQFPMHLSEAISFRNKMVFQRGD